MVVDLNKLGRKKVEREINVHLLDPVTKMMVKTVRMGEIEEYHPDLNEEDTILLNKDFNPKWNEIKNPSDYGLPKPPEDEKWYKTKVMDKRFYTLTPWAGTKFDKGKSPEEEPLELKKVKRDK